MESTITMIQYKRGKRRASWTQVFLQPRATLTNFTAMKVVIVLACLMALAAAIDEAEVVSNVADLDTAEHHRRIGYGGYRQAYGGHGGGYRRGYGGYGGHYGWGRKRRSVEDDALATDLEAAEHRRGSWGHGGRGGYGGWNHGSGYGGYGGYRRYGGYGGYHG